MTRSELQRRPLAMLSPREIYDAFDDALTRVCSIAHLIKNDPKEAIDHFGCTVSYETLEQDLVSLDETADLLLTHPFPRNEYELVSGEELSRVAAFDRNKNPFRGLRNAASMILGLHNLKAIASLPGDGESWQKRTEMLDGKVAAMKEEVANWWLVPHATEVARLTTGLGVTDLIQRWEEIPRARFPADLARYVLTPFSREGLPNDAEP